MTSNSDPATMSSLQAGYSSSAGLTINDLPNELLLKIFSYFKDPYECDLKYWSNRDTDLEDFTDVFTHRDTGLDDLMEVCTRWKILIHRSRLGYIEEYTIEEQTTEEQIVTTFQLSPQLHTVAVKMFISSAAYEALFENCPNLTTLTISYPWIDSYDYEYDGWSRHSYDPMTDKRFLEGVARLSHLHALRLTKHQNPVDQEVQLSLLADGCPQLCEIDLGYIQCQFQDLEYFINAKKHMLKHLSLMWTSVENRCIVPLLTMCADTLEHLNLRRNVHTEEETVEEFTALGQLHNLQELTLSAVWKVSDVSSERFKLPVGRAIKYISMLPKLNTLKMSYVTFENAEPGVECFLNMSALRHLRISDSTCLSIPFGRFPGRLTNLRKLELIDCAVDEEELDRLRAQMPDLDVYQPSDSEDDYHYTNADFYFDVLQLELLMHI